MARSVGDLKWIGHVVRPWHSWHVALDLRVELQPMLTVLFLLGRRPWLIGDLIALHDALPRGNAECRPQFEDWALAGPMILNVPIGGVHRLPDTIEVGL